MGIYLISACLVFILFNYYIFDSASRILVSARKKPIIYIIIAFFNTFLMVTAYYSHIPYYISYFISFLFLLLEFMLVSKAKFSQSFLCAGTIIVNISANQIIFITLYSYFNNIIPHDFFYKPEMFFECFTYLFVYLFVLFKFSEKFISNKDIIKITTTFQYVVIISVLIISILLYTIVDIIILQSKNYTFKIAPTFIFTPILTLVLFYSLIFYSLKSIKISAFKRKSDELEIKKIKNTVHKKNMENKIYKDELTGCYNRKFIMIELEERQKQNIHSFAVLFIDIDGLKFVNDNFGHKAGDDYITNISKILKKAIREEDLVSRIGGDEFLVILNDLKEIEIPNILKRIQTEIDFINNITTEYKAAASIGYIFVTEDLLKSGIDNIIKIADEKMRTIKKTSKGEGN